jgi:arylsulfatase
VFTGGTIQTPTDVVIDPAGRIWAANNGVATKQRSTIIRPTQSRLGGRVGQFRIYFADVTPGRSGEGGATLMGGVGASAARMNGYPKVFNTESDPREEHNIGEMYEWVIGPILKAVGEYKASVEKHPNPPAANLTRW